MQLPLYQVDAFVTEHPFSGNPAAVCPLDQWLDDATMQGLALENNLSETAFLVGTDGHYDLRWFTPTTEVDLCGHATLAAGFVVTSVLEPGRERVKFETRSGPLEVSLREDGLLLDLPSQPGTPRDVPEALIRGLGVTPQEVLAAPYTVCILENEDEVRGVIPHHEALLEIDRAVAVTAPGVTSDFVSRFFGRGYGVDEDPVTGSLHSILVPYWVERLNTDCLRAEQLSARGGALGCRLRGERVELTGAARLYLHGQVSL
ncbi:MAG: PhzF family phenazine biosynthesis protein [Planctomycetota bacterium]|jgi:PhzF family phenazine biosynthesis protein|nr:PhzF family phenazine biosynthesis protein [Planctomycetota bacterium]